MGWASPISRELIRMCAAARSGRSISLRHGDGHCPFLRDRVVRILDDGLLDDVSPDGGGGGFARQDVNSLALLEGGADAVDVDWVIASGREGTRQPTEHDRSRLDGTEVEDAVIPAHDGHLRVGTRTRRGAVFHRISEIVGEAERALRLDDDTGDIDG